MNKVRLVIFLCLVAVVLYKSDDSCTVPEGYVLVPEFEVPGRPRMCDGLDYYKWIDCMGVGYVEEDLEND